jgi:hypothetical protein
MIKNLLAITGTSNVLADETREFWAERLRLTGTIVHRAVARGELPTGIDPNLVIESLIGPLYVRLLFTGEPIDYKVADQVARMVTGGAGGRNQP